MNKKTVCFLEAKWNITKMPVPTKFSLIVKSVKIPMNFVGRTCNLKKMRVINKLWSWEHLNDLLNVTLITWLVLKTLQSSPAGRVQLWRTLHFVALAIFEVSSLITLPLIHPDPATLSFLFSNVPSTPPL